MPFLELTLNIGDQQHPAVEQALEELGVLSITLRNADAEKPDEQAIFEPDAGEMPLWSSIILSGLFAADTDRHHLSEALGKRLPWLEPSQLDFQDIPDLDWTRLWLDQFKPMGFGKRLWIYPWNIEPPATRDRVVVRLDPGLAFGSGAHPTTALCLAWLDGLDLSGKTVIDYGCGCGILAIAALKLGASHAVGVDHDPQALLASRDNARRNGVTHALALFAPREQVLPSADVLVANMLAKPLDTLAPDLAALSRPGSVLALSGILSGQEDALLTRYAPWFNTWQVTTYQDWVRISGHRRH